MLGFGHGAGRRRRRSAALQLVPGALDWASVRFPPENGEDPADLATSLMGEGGLLYLPNTNNLFKTTANYDTPWLGTAGAMIGACTIEPLIYDALNRTPYLCGTTYEGSGNVRYFSVRYIPGGTGSARKWRLSFSGRGESAASAYVAVDSAELPSSVTRLVWALRFDGTSFALDVWDCQTGTKYAGASVAKPTGWAGIARCTNNFSLGGIHEANFPRMTTAAVAAQNISAFRGEIGFVALLDSNPADTVMLAIAQGGDVPDLIGSAAIRLHCPLTANAALTTAITSNRAAMTNGLAQRGTLYPGSTIRRQSQAAYFTVDRLPDPCLCGVPKGASKAPLGLTFRLGGVSGPIAMRVQDEDGAIVGADWQIIATASGAQASATISLPWHPANKSYRLTFRVPLAGGGYLRTHINSDIVVALVGVHMGQSEMVYGLDIDFTTTGNTGNGFGDSYQGSQGGKQVYRASWNSSLNRAIIVRSRFNLFLATGAQIRMANRLRDMTERPLVFVRGCVVGTSAFALINDADTTRRWSDFTLALSALGNRDGQGRAVVRAVVLMWEAFFSRNDWAGQVLRPLATGQESLAQSADPAGSIAQADINHWLYDGQTLNPAFDLVVMPANRACGTTALAAADSGTMSTRRKDMRDNSLGVCPTALLGPECAVHAIEGATGASTHPDRSRKTGLGPWCRALGSAHAMGFGLLRYGGPYRFESYAWGSSNAEVIATLNASGGQLDTEGNRHAADYGASQSAPLGLAVEGWEVDDGGLGNWTREGFSAIIGSASSVVLTKSGGAWQAGTCFRFHSGGPANYTTHRQSAAEDDWVKRAPLFNGFEVAGDNTAYAVQ